MPNKYKQHLIDEEISKEMHILGIYIQNKPVKRNSTRRIEPQKDMILNLNGDLCQLIQLIEVSDYRELWEVFNLATKTNSFEFV